MRTGQKEKKMKMKNLYALIKGKIHINRYPGLQTSHSLLLKFKAESSFDQSEIVHCLGVRQTQPQVSTQNIKIS